MRVASLVPAALVALFALACGTAPAPNRAPTSVSTSAPRPNVLLIIADDQGYGDFSGHGNPHLRTPHLDRLAREGVAFTQFYMSPACSPTRASRGRGVFGLHQQCLGPFCVANVMDYIGES